MSKVRAIVVQQGNGDYPSDIHRIRAAFDESSSMTTIGPDDVRKLVRAGILQWLDGLGNEVARWLVIGVEGGVIEAVVTWVA